MRSRRPGGFFSDWRRVAVAAAIGGLLLAAALILLLKLTEPKAEEGEPTRNPVATITLQDGRQMRFELYPDQAPNTVANFIYLANRGFYDKGEEGRKQEFYRVVAGVFIQGGDPKNDGTGGPDYAIKGEFADNGVENHVSHMRGAISMARQSDFNTAGSQFFIMQGSYPEYDGHYAAFGSIAEDDTASLEVLDAIASEPVDSKYLPLTRQAIDSIRVNTYGADYDEPQKVPRK